jgi:hypothetical protein
MGRPIAAATSRVLPRRVYRRELREALGISRTWYRKLQQRNLIPDGHRDHRNGREWFTELEALTIIDKLNKQGRHA